MANYLKETTRRQLIAFIVRRSRHVLSVQMMMMEAMRLSLLEHEEQQRKEAEAKRKEEEQAKKVMERERGVGSVSWRCDIAPPCIPNALAACRLLVFLDPAQRRVLNFLRRRAHHWPTTSAYGHVLRSARAGS